MSPDAQHDLAARWLRNEAELQRLRDLPAGPTDPAERERQIDAEQDAIEYDLGLADLERRRREREQ